MLDLVKNDPATIAEAGYEFTVTLPDGKSTDAKVKVRGENSKTVREYGRRIFQERQMQAQMAKRRGKDPEDLTLAEAEELAVNGAVTRIISWSGIGEGGKEVPFTPENAKRILKEYPFIRDQVMEASNDITNFPHG